MAGPEISPRKRKTKASGVDDMLADAFGMPQDEEEATEEQGTAKLDAPSLPPSGPPPKQNDAADRGEQPVFKSPSAGPPAGPQVPPKGPPATPPSTPSKQQSEEEVETKAPAPPSAPPASGPQGGPPKGPQGGPPKGPQEGPPKGPTGPPPPSSPGEQASEDEEGADPPRAPPSGPPPGTLSSAPPSTPSPTEDDAEEEQPAESADEDEEPHREVKQPIEAAVEEEGPTVTVLDSITAYVNTDEVEKLKSEVKRLRTGLSSAADVITEIEDTPLPPIVGPDYVVASHVVADFVRLGRLLHREGLVRAGQGSISMLDPDEPGLVHASRAGCMFARMAESDIVTGRLGQKAPEGAPSDWRVHEVLLAFSSLQNEGPAACIRAISPNAIALSLDKDLVVMEPVDAHGKESFGKAVIVDPDLNDMDEYLRQLTDAMRQGNGKAICVRGAGIYSVGKTFDDAWDNAAIIEHSCEITLLTRRSGIKKK